MTDLEQITKFKPPTSFDIKHELKDVPVERLHELIQQVYRFSVNDLLKFQEGCSSVKNKNICTISICQEVLLQIIDKHDIGTDDKINKVLYIQNKKIIRELIVTTLNLLKNYSTDDVSSKILILGKLIQSLNDGKAYNFR